MLDTLLKNQSICLDTDTTNKILALTDSSIATNRVYLPEQLEKHAFLNSIP